MNGEHHFRVYEVVGDNQWIELSQFTVHTETGEIEERPEGYWGTRTWNRNPLSWIFSRIHMKGKLNRSQLVSSLMRKIQFIVKNSTNSAIYRFSS